MIGVTETSLRPSDTQGLLDEITSAGFQLHHVPRRNKRGGGVAVFVRNDIDGVHYQTDQRDTFVRNDIDGVHYQTDQRDTFEHIILDVLCTSKYLTSSIHHYVKDGISDHLAVFFTTTFPVKNSCRVKRLKIKKRAR